MIDGFPAAANQGKRFLDGVPFYGNLNQQYGIQPLLRQDVAPSAKELHVLRQTRRRAANILRLTRDYRQVADVHGCGDHYDSLVLVNRRPTLAALAVAYAVNEGVGLINLPVTLSGRIRHAVTMEVSDKDKRGGGYYREILADLALGGLRAPSPEQVEAMDWYECGPDLIVDNPMRYGLKQRHDFLEPVPEAIKELTQDDSDLRVMSWVASDRALETLRPCAPPEYPSGVLSLNQRVVSV
jgi:hypothetical protein